MPASKKRSRKPPAEAPAPQSPASTAPEHAEALEQYRRRAPLYDLELAPFEPYRRIAVGLLNLRRGDVVLDLGCGTGLSFALLREAVGDEGHIVGIEQSPEMIAHARALVDTSGWTNVTLVCAPVESARIAVMADAAIFHFTHDVLRSDEALDKVLRHLRPGARVVATGLKWAPLWALPVNFFVLNAALYSVSSLAGMEAPWSKLAGRLAGIELRSLLGGGVFIACGEVPRAGVRRRSAGAR